LMCHWNDDPLDGSEHTGESAGEWSDHRRHRCLPTLRALLRPALAFV